MSNSPTQKTDNTAPHRTIRHKWLQIPPHHRAVLMFILAGFLITVMNAFAREAAEAYHPIEIVFYRGLVALSLLTGYIIYTKHYDFYKTKRIKAHLGRALVGNFGVFTVFWAYKLLPMADVTVLLFSSPLIVTILSALFLGEKVGVYRWTAVLAGFVGVSIILSPTFDSTHFHDWSGIVPVLASISTALVAIFLRGLGKTEDAITTVFYFLLFGVLYSGIYVLYEGLNFHLQTADLLVCVGVAAFIQLMLKTEAFRLAEASMLSPYSYLMLIWATLIGYFVWGEIPPITVYIGAAIIISANLLTISREHHKNKQAKKLHEGDTMEKVGAKDSCNTLDLS